MQKNELSKNLIGHENHLSSLIDKISSKSLSNSIIIYGSKGIGKKTFI